MMNGHIGILFSSYKGIAMSEAQLHQEAKVNILEFPSKIEDHQHHENMAITMGDGHGNVLSILHSLIREGLLLGITKEEYEYFAKTIYQKEIDEFNITDHVFLFAAGPFANILTYELWKYNRNNTYIDIGSTLDKYLGLKLTRGYLQGAPTLTKKCIWE
jgi:hypothetical protein